MISASESAEPLPVKINATSLEREALGLSITDAGEINEAAQWIRREQLHSHFVAYTQTMFPAHNAPINWRLDESGKRSPWRHTRHYRIELLSDPVLEQ